MNYTIHHTTQYHYSKPVFLEPHTLRFRPRTDARQRLLACRMEIDPAPVARADLIEAEGCIATRVWFSGIVPQLTIRSECDVEILATNPFDFIPDQPHIPVQYDPAVAVLLAPGLQRRFSDRDVDQIVEEVLVNTGRETIGFLTELCQRIHSAVVYTHRADGPPYSPAETLACGSGACRDLVVLYMDCCRAAGFAARFVSGYTCQPDDDGLRCLHAWAEVYVPGGGWRGFDPTHGLAVVDDHIAVVASAEPEQASPVSGSFRGTATADVITSIRFAGDAAA
ncbi:MAG: transglutaminase family protein [Lentisphaerae bacterium]|nr:transglutaminase family protein [Lentisphaerota bacterium]